MRKKLPALVFACFLIFVAPLTVSAHTGRTDSSGGHLDSSTGDYHYHHGYEAHQHYDMDGDGVADCPYDFDDQTDHNSGSSSSSKKPSTATATTTSKKSKSPNTSFFDSFWWLLILYLSITWGPFILYLILKK